MRKKIITTYLTCLDANNLYGWEMVRKLPVNGFKCLKDLLKCNESFLKNYDEILL